MSNTKAAGFQKYGVLNGIAGNWADITGGGRSVPTSKVADGGTPEETLYGKPTYEDLTISRPFDTARDPQVEKDLLSKVGRFRTTFTEYITDPDGVVLSTKTYSVGLKGVTPPDGSSQSNDEIKLQVVLAVDGVA